MISPYFNVVGAIINLFGTVLYARDTLRGKTKPNRISWLLWGTAPIVAFSAELSKGVRLQSLIVLSSGLGPLMVLVCSFVNKKAYWKIRWFDWLCGGLSVLALILWAITGNGNVAILFSIAADALACIPTLIKSYTHPETENGYAFVAAFIGVVLTLLTIKHWTFANAAFSIYLLVANTALASMMLGRGKILAKAHQT